MLFLTLKNRLFSFSDLFSLDFLFQFKVRNNRSWCKKLKKARNGPQSVHFRKINIPKILVFRSIYLLCFFDRWGAFLKCLKTLKPKIFSLHLTLVTQSIFDVSKSYFRLWFCSPQEKKWMNTTALTKTNLRKSYFSWLKICSK